MNPYSLAVLSLIAALLLQCIATGLATQAAIRPPYQWTRMALAVGMALLALQHELSLELAARTGLFDLRQSLLSFAVSLLLLIGQLGLKPRLAETPPSR